MSVLQHQTPLKPTSNEDRQYHNNKPPRTCFKHTALVNVTGLSTQDTEFVYTEQAQCRNCQTTITLKHVSVQ